MQSIYEGDNQVAGSFPSPAQRLTDQKYKHKRLTASWSAHAAGINNICNCQMEVPLQKLFQLPKLIRTQSCLIVMHGKKGYKGSVPSILTSDNYEGYQTSNISELDYKMIIYQDNSQILAVKVSRGACGLLLWSPKYSLELLNRICDNTKMLIVYTSSAPPATTLNLNKTSLLNITMYSTRQN